MINQYALATLDHSNNTVEYGGTANQVIKPRTFKNLVLDNPVTVSLVNGDIHVRYHSFSMQARLEKANGTAANRVSLLEDARYGLLGTGSPLVRHAITQMDRWLTALSADHSNAPRIDKIVRAKPAALREGCMTRTAEPSFVAQPLDRNPASTCERLYPSGSFPREVAGADVAADAGYGNTSRPL